jgi:predicted small secreted protein
MKFYKLGLLTLLISLFILNSCKTQDGIGLDVDPATQINGTLITDTSITATTVKDDDIVTSALSARVPLSYFKDPEFGDYRN